MTFSEQIDDLVRDPTARNVAALKKRINDFVIQHINDRDEWDQDWPEIGHERFGDPCRCVNCRGRR